jgi:TonB family protein
MTLATAAAGWFAIGAFPMMEAAAQAPLNEIGPLEKQAKPITPENPIPRRTYSVDPEYPRQAAAVEANAMVTLLMTIDGNGRVAEVRRIGISPVSPASGSAARDPQALRAAFEAMTQSAAEAVRQWIYEPPAEPPLSIRVTFAFASNGSTRLAAHDGWSVAYPGQFAASGASRERAGAAGGPVQPLNTAPPPPPPPPPPPQEPPPSWTDGAIRVGGNVMAPAKTKHVNPLYPEIAQDARVQGVVILEVRIGADGKVSHARVLRSVPLLDQAALDAVMQWEFTPTRLNGQPVPVLLAVTVQFTLT